MSRSVSTCLMFIGRAREAVQFYSEVFSGFEQGAVELYRPDDTGEEGTVKIAEFSIGGHAFKCIDSPPVHDFTFTPSISIFMDCDDEAEIDRLFGALSDRGAVMMPLDTYPFSTKFAWVADRFGVSWQLNLP